MKASPPPPVRVSLPGLFATGLSSVALLLKEIRCKNSGPFWRFFKKAAPWPTPRSGKTPAWPLWRWGLFFSHPKDFTPVCTTELGAVARLKPEWDKRNIKPIGISVDPVDDHGRWAADIAETQGAAVNFPMIGDPDLSIAKLYGMLPAASGDTSQGRTAADNQTVRNVFIIGPDKKIKLILVYPMTTGRNFQEILRVIDSLQMTAKHRVATPADWKQGDDVIIAGSVSNDEAKTIYPDGWKAPKPYLRIVPQPK